MSEIATRYAEQDMGTYRVRQLRIVIPFVQGGLADETKAWGEKHKAEFVDLTGDDEGYFKLVTRLWSEGVGFYLVEQDIEPTELQFTDMAACSREWCAGTHRLLHEGAREQWNMGLMKFSDKLLARHFDKAVSGREGPDGADCIAQRLELTGMDYKPMGSNRSWRRVDLAVYDVIGGAGSGFLAAEGNPQPHLHGPAGRHLHIEMDQRRGYSLSNANP